MKANELMQGDLVLYEYNGEKIHARVVEVYRSSVLVESVSKEYEPIEIAEDKLFPVALTPEILEKNKLLKHDGFELDFSRHHRLKVILLWTDAKGISRPQITFYLPKPQYVHELQHALRLCGIEKEIEL